MSRLTILLLTYQRTAYASKALHEVLVAAKRWRATYPHLSVALHIADDGSPMEHVHELLSIAKHHDFTPTLTVSNRRGYGGNYNLATQAIHDSTDVVLPLEDDWTLVGNLPVGDIVGDLLGQQEIGCVRLGYVGFTDSLWGVVRSVGTGGRKYLLFDPDSEEKHVFAGHPRLETVAWEKRVGPWPEGISQGRTELEVCGIPAARVGVAWPMFINPDNGPFVHIGTEKAPELAGVDTSVARA